MIVPWKSCNHSIKVAFIAFDSRGSILSIFSGWILGSESLHILVRSTLSTFWLIAPSEESWEPLNQFFKLFDLIRNGSNFLWNTTNCHDLSYLVLILKSIFNLTLDPEIELLLLKHISWHIFCTHIGESLCHFCFEHLFKNAHCLGSIFFRIRCNYFIIHSIILELKLTTTWHELALTLKCKIVLLFRLTNLLLTFLSAIQSALFAGV